jgi:hypothetical protein
MKAYTVALDISHLDQTSKALAPTRITAGGGIKAAPVAMHRRKRQLTTNILVAIDVPNDLFGYQFGAGSSVHASGLCALEFARAELAELGIPASELERIRPEHVEFQRLTVKYVLEFGAVRLAARVADAMRHRITMLGLRNGQVLQLDHVHNSYALPRTADHPSNRDAEMHGAMEDAFTMAIIWPPNATAIQIEIGLASELLRRRHWEKLMSWRDAYKTKRYQRVFHDFVRGVFQLDDNHICEPIDTSTLGHLDRVELRVLEAYYGGRELGMVGNFAPPRPKSQCLKVFGSLRRRLLMAAGEDIKVPWATYRLQQHKILMDRLKYPTSPRLNAKRPADFFCEDNWPGLLAALRQRTLEQLEG